MSGTDILLGLWVLWTFLLVGVPFLAGNRIDNPSKFALATVVAGQFFAIGLLLLGLFFAGPTAGSNPGVAIISGLALVLAGGYALYRLAVGLRRGKGYRVYSGGGSQEHPAGTTEPPPSATPSAGAMKPSPVSTLTLGTDPEPEGAAPGLTPEQIDTQVVAFRRTQDMTLSPTSSPTTATDLDSIRSHISATLDSLHQQSEAMNAAGPPAGDRDWYDFFENVADLLRSEVDWLMTESIAVQSDPEVAMYAAHVKATESLLPPFLATFGTVGTTEAAEAAETGISLASLINMRQRFWTPERLEAELVEYRTAFARGAAGKITPEQLEQAVAWYRKALPEQVTLSRPEQDRYVRLSGETLQLGWFSGYRTRPVAAVTDLKLSLEGLLSKQASWSATITNLSADRVEGIEYELLLATHILNIPDFRLLPIGTETSGFIHVLSHAGGAKLPSAFVVVQPLEPGESRRVAVERRVGRCARVATHLVLRRVLRDGVWSEPEPVDEVDAMLTAAGRTAALEEPHGQPSIQLPPTTDPYSALEKYTVNYRGGLPDYPTGHAGGIDLFVLRDSFVLRPTTGSKGWFAGLTIPYTSVTAFEIAQRQVSTVEGILGGLDSRQLNQANNIHIGLRVSGQNLVLRLEMLSGTTVMGQAAKCRELVDRLRVHGILNRLTEPQTGDASTGPSDPIDQIARLANLRDQGILSTDEFEAKKAELLGRL